MVTASRLILGGHSFIEALGNDPAASFEEQCAIVAACLDSGIRRIDTTYYQERIALGRVLQTLGRRDEAAVLAWNFFQQPGRENDLVSWTPYEAHHLPVLLDELQTDRVDLLVIHAHDDVGGLRAEMELAAEWKAAGRVGEVGLGMAQTEHLRNLPNEHPITHVLAPFNAFNQNAAELFAAARAQGLQTAAMSPFVRGWKLDEIGEDVAEVADILLRWVAAQPQVDYIDIALRKREWVAANLRSLARGPLNSAEQARLDRWLNRKPV